MAEAFKNAYLDITSTNNPIYTNTSGGEAIVISLRVTNVDGAADDTVTADVIDGTSGNSRLAFEMTVPAGTSIELAGTSKIVLENGDKIELTGGAASGDLEGFASVLEITA
jgi:hypothetical protein